jgi:GNAT superfamily N-acetyltransferase
MVAVASPIPQACHRAAPRIREATGADNAALLRLAAESGPTAGISFCTRREPDYFALCRLRGEPWQVIVAEDATHGVIGSVGVTETRSWLNGDPTRLLHVGDLRVHPRSRHLGIGRRLLAAARDCCDAVGPRIPVLGTVLAGNRAMDARVRRPCDRTSLLSVGTVGIHSLLPARHAPRPDRLVLRSALASDVQAMARLWQQVMPARQCATRLDATDWQRWVAQVPDLDWSDYTLAFEEGRLAGFVGAWEQRGVKETIVLDYGAVAGLVRRIHDVFAGLSNRPPLPRPGEALHALHAVHACVPGDRPDLLRALLDALRHRAFHRGASLVEFGLDRQDPLAIALHGVPRLTTDLCCFLTAGMGRFEGPAPDHRPIHFEPSLA